MEEQGAAAEEAIAIHFKWVAWWLGGLCGVGAEVGLELRGAQWTAGWHGELSFPVLPTPPAFSSPAFSMKSVS